MRHLHVGSGGGVTLALIVKLPTGRTRKISRQDAAFLHCCSGMQICEVPAAQRMSSEEHHFESQVARASTRMLTPCNHFFHSHCLQRWMEIRADAGCPICRAALPPP
jgi:Ring finger domain